MSYVPEEAGQGDFAIASFSIPLLTPRESAMNSGLHVATASRENRIVQDTGTSSTPYTKMRRSSSRTRAAQRGRRRLSHLQKSWLMIASIYALRMNKPRMLPIYVFLRCRKMANMTSRFSSSHPETLLLNHWATFSRITSILPAIRVRTSSSSIFFQCTSTLQLGLRYTTRSMQSP